MSDKQNHIPLPPALLTVVPFITMPVCVVLAVSVFPGGGAWSALAGVLIGFGAPALWLAKRVRRLIASTGPLGDFRWQKLPKTQRLAFGFPSI